MQQSITVILMGRTNGVFLQYRVNMMNYDN